MYLLVLFIYVFLFIYLFIYMPFFLSSEMYYNALS